MAINNCSGLLLLNNQHRALGALLEHEARENRAENLPCLQRGSAMDQNIHMQCVTAGLVLETTLPLSQSFPVPLQLLKGVFHAPEIPHSIRIEFPF